MQLFGAVIVFLTTSTTQAHFGFGSLDIILLESLYHFLAMCTKSKQKLMRSPESVP